MGKYVPTKPSQEELANYTDVYQAALSFILKRSKENSAKHGWVELDVDGAHTLLSNFDITELVDGLEEHHGGNLPEAIKEIFS